MRLIDRLWESLIALCENSLEQLLAPFENLGDEGRAAARTNVEWALETLKKNSRVTWALRWIKMALFRRYGDERRFARERDRLARLSGRSPEEIEAAVPDSLRAFRERLDHFFAPAMLRSIPEIRRYAFQYQTPDEAFAQFEQWEEAHADKEGVEIDRLIPDEDLFDEDVEKVYPNGWVIARLNRNECDQYGYAMRHCGRPNKPTEGGTFVVLRRPVYLRDGEIVHSPDEGDTYWYPIYMFELDGDGYYRQMKGRRNSKPSKKHHDPYIVDMLTLPYVEGIGKGDWFKPENDFHFDDLSPELQERVKELNYGFEIVDLRDGRLRRIYQKEGLSPRFFQYLRELGLRAESWSHNEIEVPFDYGSVRDFCRNGGVLSGEPKEIFAILDAEYDDDWERFRENPDLSSWVDDHDLSGLLRRVVIRLDDEHPEFLQRLLDWVAARTPLDMTAEDVRNRPERFIYNDRVLEAMKPTLYEALAHAMTSSKVSGIDTARFMDLVAYGIYGDFGFMHVSEPESSATVKDFLDAPVSWILNVDGLMEALESAGEYGMTEVKYFRDMLDAGSAFDYEYHAVYDKVIEGWRYRQRHDDPDSYGRRRKLYDLPDTSGSLPVPEIEYDVRTDLALEYLYDRFMGVQESFRPPSLRRLRRPTETRR